MVDTIFLPPSALHNGADNGAVAAILQPSKEKNHVCAFYVEKINSYCLGPCTSGTVLLKGKLVLCNKARPCSKHFTSTKTISIIRDLKVI